MNAKVIKILLVASVWFIIIGTSFVIEALFLAANYEPYFLFYVGLAVPNAIGIVIGFLGIEKRSDARHFSFYIASGIVFGFIFLTLFLSYAFENTVYLWVPMLMSLVPSVYYTICGFIMFKSKYGKKS